MGGWHVEIRWVEVTKHRVTISSSADSIYSHIVQFLAPPGQMNGKLLGSIEPIFQFSPFAPPFALVVG